MKLKEILLGLFGGKTELKDSRYYEEQIDFSNVTDDNRLPKILAYYLPQFHPIPENDKWHGIGFTEWTKVRQSAPLFKGHYQRHYPHDDIGHYIIDDNEILKKQALIMKKSGVSGMVFYHYWFSGKLILENPAQRVLGDKDIDMPFCFCWANENWSRRWDGNEKEVLLKQDYSIDDAINFIKYLLPFFKDKRYININGRPVLIIYKPSYIKDINLYVQIWNDVLSENGLPSIYLVACISSDDFFDSNPYDCYLERPLYDWGGGGNISDIKNKLSFLISKKCKVIEYKDVVDFYSNKEYLFDKSLWRSNVTCFDNTPRYGGDAYVTYGSNPELFER